MALVPSEHGASTACLTTVPTVLGALRGARSARLGMGFDHEKWWYNDGIVGIERDNQ